MTIYSLTILLVGLQDEIQYKKYTQTIEINETITAGSLYIYACIFPKPCTNDLDGDF